MKPLILLLLLTAPGLCATQAVLKTELGDINIELDEARAPQTCAQFKSFIKAKIYRDTHFHSGNGGTIQGGLPGPKAEGYSGMNFPTSKATPGEFALPHVRGAVGISRSFGACNPEKRSNSTMFYIHTADFPNDNGEFTIFGRVVSGMEIVDQILARLKDNKDEKNRVELDVKLKKG